MIQKKKPVAWVSLGNGAIFYAVSSDGMLAVVEGGKLKFYEPVIEMTAANP